MKDLDSTLTYYGYRRARRGVHRSDQYDRKDGHSVTVTHAGDWSHSGGQSAFGGKKGNSGRGLESLKQHLSSVHGSQHSEEPSQYQPSETPVYLGAPPLEPIVQFREGVVAQNGIEQFDEQFGEGDHEVVYTDKHYNTIRKVFKNDPKGPPENALTKARAHAAAIDKKHRSSTYGLVRGPIHVRPYEG